ncbi:MAG TPA: phosphoribosylaminoimidazolesuccinocarboxamide synthase [Candidatus Dormibacteraeota bacterium]
MTVVSSADIADLKLFRRGKVRDTYELGDGSLLMVATDRISAFDVVLPTPIPDKGRVLTQMSLRWFDLTNNIVPNHLLAQRDEALPAAVPVEWRERCMHVARADRIDIECVVRGFISGSGWKEYRRHGTLAEEPLPEGLRESARLPEPRFTPAMKNDDGHDENISRARLRDLIGTDLADQLEAISLRIFEFATARCEAAGIHLADTKFEFGFSDGNLSLIDEVLTPDSSRFWEMSTWREGETVPSFDKQFVRDYLETLEWDKTPPGPDLPDDVVLGTAERYRQAARRISGVQLS